VTNHLRLAALAAAVLAACGDDPTTAPTLLLAEPSAVAVYRGLTPKHAAVHPYLAIASAASNDLTLLDALDDTAVLAPVPLRPMVIPVPNRPALLAAAELGDGGPDLLVAVSAGSSELQVIRTWISGGGVGCGEAPACVDLGADVLALVALPPPATGQARVAAALAGGGIAVVTYGRSTVPGDETAIELVPLAVSSAALPFQPVALAIVPGDGTRIWAASPDLLGAVGVDGIARIDVDAGGAPSFAGPTAVLDARAPTRLVAAARLAERPDGSGEAGLDPLTWPTTAPTERVYAILDESFCGLDAEIACGLVALDPGTGALALDPAPAGTMLAPFRAPIAVPGRPLALGATPPPVHPPSPADPQYAGTYMRVATALGARTTTGAAAVASSDGAIYYVDLGRWELPSDQLVAGNVGASVTASAAAGAPGQWLVLERGGSAVSHLDAAGLAGAVGVTAGFTPTARWTVTYEGVLPGLASRRAESGADGTTPWLALQVGVPGTSEIVRLYDPTLGVRGGDTVVVEPTNLTSCTATFEATVDPLVPFLPPDAARPGGAVRLVPKADPAHPEWDVCVGALLDPQPIASTALGVTLRATFRAGDPAGGDDRFVLVRGTGAAAIHVGRPALGAQFDLAWTDETTFGACTLPPAVPWPGTLPCTDACRDACQDLLRARLARRIGYVPESGAVDLPGPALRFTLALETAAAPARGLALVVDTREGRTPLRDADPAGAAVNARAVVPFDRSALIDLRPDAGAGGVRFLVPYTSGVVLDATPTVRGGVVPLR
jgi:hypothetical protein